MQNTSNSPKQPKPRPAFLRAHDLEVARKIERDRLEKERNRQEERQRYITRRQNELFDAWLAAQRLRCRDEAAAEYDRERPPITFADVAAIHVPQTFPGADLAEQTQHCKAALEEWLAANPDRRTCP